jgi:hypothetical protein
VVGGDDASAQQFIAPLIDGEGEQGLRKLKGCGRRHALIGGAAGDGIEGELLAITKLAALGSLAGGLGGRLISAPASMRCGEAHWSV